VTEPSLKQSQGEDGTNKQSTYPCGRLPHRIRVTGVQGVDAAVVVTVAQDAVWMSIMPPFIWHIVMEPGKVDELIRTLQAARREVETIGAAGCSPRADTTIPREITKGPGLNE
jgi:hypothetical protein